MCLSVYHLFWVSSLAYPNLLETKGYVVVVVEAVQQHRSQEELQSDHKTHHLRIVMQSVSDGCQHNCKVAAVCSNLLLHFI
jgi:predicted double-glycine peptidase